LSRPCGGERGDDAEREHGNQHDIADDHCWSRTGDRPERVWHQDALVRRLRLHQHSFRPGGRGMIPKARRNESASPALRSF
jgi:hypothetical protein